jgi:hypothetical protein
MTKQEKRFLISVVPVAGLLIYCWTIFLFTDVAATWRHYLALLCFSGLAFLFFKDVRKTILGTAVYLFMGTCNLLALTPTITISSYGVTIGSLKLETPTFQLLSFGLLLFFLTVNFDALVNIYLDYKESKEAKRK